MCIEKIVQNIEFYNICKNYRIRGYNISTVSPFIFLVEIFSEFFARLLDAFLYGKFLLHGQFYKRYQKVNLCRKSTIRVLSI